MYSSHIKITALIILNYLFVTCINHENSRSYPQSFSHSENAENSGFDPARLARIDSVINHYVNTGILPNAVTFVARRGNIVHNKAYGYKNMEEGLPLETSSIFRIASQTKAITTTALMILYEEGKFLLDDPVSMYIPWFSDPAVMTSFDESDTTFTSRPATREITIRHLLNHTSGIHYGIYRTGAGNMIYAKAGIPAVNSMDPITNEEVVRRISSLPLMFDPGERFLYGMNTDVAGYLVEVLSGKPLDIFFRERIFEPLGMKDTYFYLPGEKSGRLVTLYTPDDEGPSLHPDQTYSNYPVEGARMWLSGGAGLSGTIEDYARFCQMLLNNGTFNGNRILSRKTIELMTINQIGDLEYGSLGRRFGLGFDIWGDQTPAHHLGSSGSVRWGGLFYTNYVIDPEEELILLFYTNVQPWQGPNLQEKFHNLVYQAIE